MEKRPTEEQLAKYRKNAQDQSLSAEVRAKFQAVVDKFETTTEKIGEDVVKAVEPKKRGRKPASTATAKKTTTTKAKKSVDDIEKAKAEIKRKTGKTEAECESIIEQYRALRTKAQEGKRKAEQASAENKKRVEKLDNKGDIIEGTNEKTADAVIESTAKDVAEKIEKQVEAVEAKAETEAKAEVAKDKTIKTPKAKKEEVEAKVEEKVKKETKTIVKRVVIDTSALLTSIATSLGKFDKDSQKEFLIKLRSDIDKLLAKYSAGGLTDGGVQVMNIQQSNLSASSVNPTLFAKGGGVVSVYDLRKGDKIKTRKGNIETIERKIESGYFTKESEYSHPFESIEFVERPNRKMATGGVVGQEIVFDDNGEENRGVIKSIHEITGDYIVNSDDGRTILAQRDRDVISLGGMRKKASMMDAPRKRFGFFGEGGGVEREKVNTLIGKTNYDEYYFLDDIFQYKDGFKGATGTSIIPVSKEHYDYATSRDGILERYVDAMGEEEWLETLGLNEDDFEDEDEKMSAIEEGIYDLHLAGELNPFEEANYDQEEQMRALPEFSDEDEYPVFEVVGGGRIFGKDVKFEKIYNKTLYNRIRQVEEFARGGGIKEVIVYDNGGQSFDRYTIFTPDGSVYGMSDNALMPNGFNQYLGDNTEVEKGSHLGKRLKSVPESIKVAVERRMSEDYAKGGLTEHGLRVGDTIIEDFGDDEIGVRSINRDWHRINLDKGKRFAKGGNVSSMLRNRRGM